jgi:hypothetical protein
MNSKTVPWYIWWMVSPGILVVLLLVIGVGKLGDGIAAARNRTLALFLLHLGGALLVAAPTGAFGLFALSYLRPPTVSFVAATPAVDPGSRPMLWLLLVLFGTIFATLGVVEVAVAFIVGGFVFLLSVALLASLHVPSQIAFVVESTVALLSTLMAFTVDRGVLKLALQKWSAIHA